MAKIIRPRFGGGLAGRLARLEADVAKRPPPLSPPTPPRRGWRHYGSPGIRAGWIDWEPRYGPWSAVEHLLDGIDGTLCGEVVEGKRLDDWLALYDAMMAGTPLAPLPPRQPAPEPTDADWARLERSLFGGDGTAGSRGG